MTFISRLKSFHLFYLSKPAGDRPLFRAVRDCTIRKIVELEIGSGQRALRMIDLAKRGVPEAEIHYVGMDLFEGRPADREPALPLKTAHQLLRNTGVRVQLVPGTPTESLIRLANSLGKVDLLVLPNEFETPAAARAWFFVPRILHDRSLVFVEHRNAKGSASLVLKTQSEIAQLAKSGFSRRAA